MKIAFFTDIKHKIAKKLCISEPLAKTREGQEFVTPSLTHLKAYMQKLDNRNVCKKLCIDFLKKENPQEKVFILDDIGRIIADHTGDSERCFFKLPDKKGLSILHGHRQISQGLTLPISFQDFFTLNKHDNINEIVAFSIEGKESVLRKNANFKKINRKALMILEKNYREYLISHAGNKEKEKLNELITYCNTNKNSDAVLSQIASIMSDLQYQQEGAIAIDKFWKDHAELLNLCYIPF